VSWINRFIADLKHKSKTSFLAVKKGIPTGS